MRVIGIDPGSLRTGWGVVERRGTKLVGIAADVIRLPDGEDLAERLRRLREGLAAAIAEHRPTAAAVEDIFQAKFARSALLLGQARGVALLAAAEAGLKVTAYPPAVVKRAIAGSGRAEKAQVAQIVGAILNLAKLPPTDATDALAIAITHAQARHPASR